MGADLYMLDQNGGMPSSDNDQEYERRYYRDSYNATSLLWALGLSWWADVSPMLDESYLLQPDRAQQLLAEVESRPLPTPENLVKTSAFEWATVDDGANSPQVWWSLIEGKRVAFLDFLQRAIQAQVPIYCSV